MFDDQIGVILEKLQEVSSTIENMKTVDGVEFAMSRKDWDDISESLRKEMYCNIETRDGVAGLDFWWWSGGEEQDHMFFKIADIAQEFHDGCACGRSSAEIIASSLEEAAKLIRNGIHVEDDYG